MKQSILKILVVLALPLMAIAGDSIDNNGKCPENLPIGADCPHASLISLHQDELIFRGDGIDNNRDDRCRRNPDAAECKQVAHKLQKASFQFRPSLTLQLLDFSCLTSEDSLKAKDWADQAAVNSYTTTPVTHQTSVAKEQSIRQVDCPDLQKICQDRTAEKACRTLQKRDGKIRLSFSQESLKTLISEDLTSFNPSRADLKVDIYLGEERLTEVNFCYSQASGDSYLIGCNIKLDEGHSLNMSALVR